jgi:hypothetical protein
MLELHRQRVKGPEITRRFGKALMTMYRIIERLHDHRDRGRPPMIIKKRLEERSSANAVRSTQVPLEEMFQRH